MVVFFHKVLDEGPTMRRWRIVLYCTEHVFCAIYTIFLNAVKIDFFPLEMQKFKFSLNLTKQKNNLDWSLRYELIFCGFMFEKFMTRRTV